MTDDDTIVIFNAENNITLIDLFLKVLQMFWLQTLCKDNDDVVSDKERRGRIIVRIFIPSKPIILVVIIL